MPFLIDGHNVIAALLDIDLEDPDDEAKLVMKLRAWSSRARRKAIVVFDGGLPGGPSPTLSSADVKVVFAARHHTNADRIIGERLKQLPDAPNWTVVSSDHEILDEALMIGARTLTAQAFAEMLERPPEAEKEKPDAISSSEIEEWLQIFGEPLTQGDEISHQTPVAADDVVQRRAPKPQPPRRPPAPPRHATRSIADQIGIELPPDPEAGRPSDKPEAPSRAEVQAWLEVFHDDPGSTIPPPKLPERKPRVVKPVEPVVRKAGTLSEAEVASWLSVFDDREDRESGAGTETIEPATRPLEAESKLAKHRKKMAPAEGEEEAALSEDDLELWHRLFGDG
jgi:uncharacterized protein